MLKNALIIANPAASRGGAAKALARLQKLIKQNHPDTQFDFMSTERPSHATELARTHAADYDAVIAFGGDGTINEVAQGLIGGDTPMGVIPFGTGNDFARSARLPLKIPEALAFLTKEEAIPTDIGMVNGQPFVNAVGIGFDGHTNYEAGKIRWLRGPVVILVAIVKTFKHWKGAPMKVTLGDVVIESENFMVDIGNGHSIGGGLLLTPKAKLDDGKLHVCHVKNLSPMKVMLNFSRLKTGTADQLDEITVHVADSVVVESESDLPVHMDGEQLGMNLHRLELGIRPGALQVIRPKA